MRGKILAVGTGMGFVVATRRDFLVITAAHCLPDFPTPASFLFEEEYSYGKLLGRYGTDPTVVGRLLFADPVADIAVLTAIDGQSAPEFCEAFEQLTEATEPLRVGALPAPVDKRGTIEIPGSVTTLGLEKAPVTIDFVHGNYNGGGLWTKGYSIQAGMSGGPILLPDGSVIGVTVTTMGPHPCLPRHLPAWLLEELKLGE